MHCFYRPEKPYLNYYFIPGPYFPLETSATAIPLINKVASVVNNWTAVYIQYVFMYVSIHCMYVNSHWAIVIQLVEFSPDIQVSQAQKQ